LKTATRIAVNLDHPEYDCLYLALAVENGSRFISTDERFLVKLRARRGRFRSRIISLTEAASSPGV